MGSADFRIWCRHVGSVAMVAEVQAPLARLSLLSSVSRGSNTWLVALTCNIFSRFVGAKPE